jgi:hypothetical protein
MAKVRTPAVAYLRTSSAANVGPDKDSRGGVGRASKVGRPMRPKEKLARCVMTTGTWRIWVNYQDELQRAGYLFYTWQHEVQWAIVDLRREGFYLNAIVSYN